MELQGTEGSEEEKLNRAERENSAKVLQKMVERQCPEENPTENITNRNCE
jgi:hypothetical protein